VSCGIEAGLKEGERKPTVYTLRTSYLNSGFSGVQKGRLDDVKWWLAAMAIAKFLPGDLHTTLLGELL
jgi:hypothetical protein